MWYDTGVATDGSAIFVHGAVYGAVVEMDRYFVTGQVKIPVEDTNKESTTYNVTESGRDHGFPNVVAYGQVGMALEDC
jgi:hypothetical protein